MSREPNFYMVLADNSPQTRVRHPNPLTAKTEAERLSKQNPGVRFFVLASLGAFITEHPCRWEEHDEIPF